MRSLHLLELPEDDLLILRWDAWTVVGDGEQHTVILAPRADVECDRVCGMRDRILDQVPEDSLEDRPVGLDGGRFRCDLDARGCPFLLEPQLPLGHQLLKE